MSTADIWPPFADSLPAGLDGSPLPTQPGAASPRTQPSILLLDDDPFMLGMQSRMLRSMGYAMIGTASSAEAALARLHDHPRAVDVIVCDLNMPGVDGIAFLQRLSASPFRGNVILLSGEGLRIMHTVQRLMVGGPLILGALEKPATRQALRAMLDCWRRPAVPETVAPAPVFSGDEVVVAGRAEQWLLHYQPQVDLRTGALIGMEALVRWQHPLYGVVYPDRFIAIAEECGAIDKLTDWVLRQAVRQLGRWHDQGLRIHMAVNVSMENLRSADFARGVASLVQASRISPQDLTLEITESRLMAPSPAPLESLVRLRMQRFGLSIDDFGTGHSSLAQLRDVPFTELKVDRGFVQGARHNQIIRPMLEGSIGIAKRLGMTCVAEGVETEDDWHLLREIGCDLAQGYFVGRPMESGAVDAWCRHWKARQPHLVGVALD